MAAKKLFFSCVVLMALAGGETALWGQTGGFAYVANCGNFCGRPGPGDVSAYTIDVTTGALTEVVGSPFLAGPAAFSVTVHPNGQFAYVANQASNNVSAYTIDSGTGALTPIAGSPFAAGLSPSSVTVDPTGRFAYVANSGSSNDVSAYVIDGATGALTPVVGSRFPAGGAPQSVTTTAGPQPPTTAAKK